MRHILLAAMLVGLAPRAEAAGSKYYVVIRGIDEAKGVQSGVVPELKQLFVDELKRHPEFTLEAPAGLPEEPQAMFDELKKRKLKAFEMTLKVLAVTKETRPPEAGKQYRTLVRGIKLNVFGDTIPEKVMALGGDGESQVGAEIGKTTNEEKEGHQLLLEASKEAIKQAVDMTVTKLNLNDKTVKLKGKPTKSAAPGSHK